MNRISTKITTVLLRTIFFILLLLCISIVPVAADTLSYPVMIAPITGGIASVTTDAIDGQSPPEATITVSIDIPDKEGQYNHRFKSITIYGADDKEIQTLEMVTGETYSFTMPYQPVTIMVELEICPLSVYVQHDISGEPVLAHIYNQTEMENLCITDPQYYTGLDSMPSVIQGKGIGVLLSTLIDDLKQYDEDITFNEGSAIKLSSADRYSATFTYKYLLGEPRYYYPHLSDSEYNLEDAIKIEPLLAVTSFQARYLTREILDSYPMDSSTSYRFCFGLLSSDAANTTVTINRFAKWVNCIDIIESAEDVKDSNISDIKITDTTIMPFSSQPVVKNGTGIGQDLTQDTGISPVLTVAIIVAMILVIGSLLYLVWRKRRST